MASKTLKVVQHILEYLDESMDEERIELSPISPENLEISEVRWNRIIGMMMEELLIEGFADIKFLGSKYTTYKAIEPRITLKGLQFMSDNSNASRLYEVAKEIKGWIPGLS